MSADWTVMNDDQSWHCSNVKMNKPKRKRSSSARKTQQPKGQRRRGRPRDWTTIDDDESWHGSDVKMSKPKRKRSSSGRKTKQTTGPRRRGRPRGRPVKGRKQEPKEPTCRAGQRRRGLGRASNKAKTEAREDCTAKALPSSNAANWEEIMDECCKQYVYNIEPDLSTVVPSKDRDSSLPCTGRQYRCTGRQYPCCDEETTKRRRASSAPGRRAGSSRHRSSPDDTCVVPKLPPGPLADLLPPGTRVRRPARMLVQLVAETIHESPLRALRVQHVYEALQNKYPFFRFMSKKEVTSWKSSIRHALYQRWFTKVHPSSEARDACRTKSSFWRLNYANRPHDWDMPDDPHPRQIEDKMLDDTLAALMASRQSPRITTPQESPACSGVPVIPMAPACSQLSNQQLGLQSPTLSFRNQQQEERKAYQVLLAPQPVTHPQQQHKQEKQEKQLRSQLSNQQLGLKSPLRSPRNQQQKERKAYEVLLAPAPVTHRRQQHKQEKQGKQLRLQHHEHQQKQPAQSPACPTPASSPLIRSPQSWSADSSMMSPPLRPHTSPPWCNDLYEIATGNQLGPFCAQGVEARPNSRLSTSSHPVSSYGAQPSFLGSPAKHPRQVELQLQHLGAQAHKMEPFAAPPSPSIYVRAKQDWQPPLQSAWSGEFSDLYNSQSPRNPNEHSTGSDFQVWNEHPYAKRISDASGPCGAGEPLAPPPFLCSPRLRQGMPGPPAGGGCRFAPQQQEPQLAPGEQFLSRPEPSFSGQLRQEQETMTFYQQLPSRPEPPRSQEGTLPQQEPPPPRHDLRSPHEHSPPRRPGSPALPEPPFSGRWIPGPRFWPGRSALQNLPMPPNSGEPVYSAIATPVRMLCMEDGTPYILGYPTFEEHHPWAANAKWLWEEYPRIGLNHDQAFQYTPGGRRAD